VRFSGFVWAVRWANVDGWAVVDGSAKADKWRNRMGISFHKVGIVTNVYELSLVFRDVVVDLDGKAHPALGASVDNVPGQALDESVLGSRPSRKGFVLN